MSQRLCALAPFEPCGIAASRTACSGKSLRWPPHLGHGDGDAGAAHEAADDRLAEILSDPAQPEQPDHCVHEAGQERNLHEKAQRR